MHKYLQKVQTETKIRLKVLDLIGGRQYFQSPPFVLHEDDIWSFPFRPSFTTVSFGPLRPNTPMFF